MEDKCHGHESGSDDPFLRNYQPSELRIAFEFLTTWLPFLSKDLCPQCSLILSHRLRSINPGSRGVDFLSKNLDENLIVSRANNYNSTQSSHEVCSNHDDHDDDDCDTHSLGSWKDGAEENSSGWSEPVQEEAYKPRVVETPTPSPRMSWADMAQEEDELFGEEELELTNSSVHLNSLQTKAYGNPTLPREQRESIRFMNVRRKKDFICFERVNGKLVNILEGLELHTGVFSAAEQERIVNFVTLLQEMGRKGELKDRTYTAPQKWMRGKGRQTIQFGCCYNYAVDKYGNPPGILHNTMVDPLPDLFKVIIRRLIRWHVLPPTCVPDSCIVNIYEEGDCIPPHIDNHDFVRPFCTVSFLSECKIIFGSNLKVIGAGEFDGPIAIPLPLGSVLVLNGNGADVAKHCVPAVPKKRISITFRKMDASKWPIGYAPEPDLLGIQPLVYEDDKERRSSGPKPNPHMKRHINRRGGFASRSDRFLEPREFTQRPQRPVDRRSRAW